MEHSAEEDIEIARIPSGTSHNSKTEVEDGKKDTQKRWYRRLFKKNPETDRETLIVLVLFLCWRFWGDFPDRFTIILIELVKRMVTVDVGNKLSLTGKLLALAADSEKNKKSKFINDNRTVPV